MSEMATYTIFCQEKLGRGTIWIDSVEASSIEDAKERGIAKCSFDWNYDPLEIHVLGVAAGTPNILEWIDLNDD
jgi:pimeloyl-CoA synthetase